MKLTRRYSRRPIRRTIKSSYILLLLKDGSTVVGAKRNGTTAILKMDGSHSCVGPSEILDSRPLKLPDWVD